LADQIKSIVVLPRLEPGLTKLKPVEESSLPLPESLLIKLKPIVVSSQPEPGLTKLKPDKESSQAQPEQ